jgi:non-heme chloroperoxidase
MNDSSTGSTICEVRMRDDAIERLFSLFTSQDLAAAMAGDLIEERRGRGWIWFWRHVLGVTLVLWWRAALKAPLRMLALAIAGGALAIAPALGAVVAASLFPIAMGSLLTWSAGALATAAVLTVIARQLGLAASAALALAGEALVVSCALVIPNLVAAQPIEWKDASPHTTKLVTVEDGVQLEVLDWGGSGPALVLLAGLGATAHHYDDVAPMLAARYRVVGVTRRGHRGSSAAAAGYGFARLAEDVLRVIDAAGVSSPVVIGHSFAGEEMHVLGARHAAKIRGLVYVDAAFDRGDDADSEAYNGVAKTVPSAPGPQPADRASFAALRAYLDKYGGAGPEAYLRTRYLANPDGTVGGVWAPDLSIRQAMMKEIQAAYKPYNPEPIRVPALAIYALPKSAEDLMRRGSSDRMPFPELVARAAADPALRDGVEKLYLLTRERVRKHEKWFEAFAATGRVVELSGTHNLFISNPGDVLAQIEAFMSSLVSRAK